jgi:hypothetical protein
MSFAGTRVRGHNVVRNDLSEWCAGQYSGRRSFEENVMKLELGQSRLDLDRDQLIAVRDGKGVRVSCLSGALWITQEQSTSDVVLEMGQSFVINHPGLTLVMALRPSNLRVSEPRASAIWDGLRDWFGARLFRGHAVA